VANLLFPQALSVTIPARANTPSTLTLAWYAKHPNDAVVYLIDATGFMQYAGRTIVSATVTAAYSSSDPTPIVISNVLAGAGVTYFTASGGSDVTQYGITWVATLDDGSTLTRVIWLPVLSLFPNTATPTIIAKGDPGQSGSLSLATLNDLLNQAPVGGAGEFGGVYLAGSTGGPYGVYFVPFTGEADPGVLSLGSLNALLNTAPVNEIPTGGGLYLGGSTGGPYAVFYADPPA
jgi:hypothetical protein